MSDNNENNNTKSEGGNIIAGVILITLGGLFLIDRYLPEIDFRDLWPWALIVAGILILVKGIKSK